MQSEEDFIKAIERAPVARVKDSSGKTKVLTGKEARETGLHKAISATGPAQIYETDEGWSVNIKDPFDRTAKEVANIVSIEAPKVKIDGNKVKLQATKEMLNSPLAAQIREEMKSLTGADLSNPEVQNAVDALNKEVEESMKNTMLQSSMGWTLDQYNDYAYTKQSVSGTNPMQSSNKVKGKDKNGNIIMKTPQEWVDYYRSAYNTEERQDAYNKSYQSSDPYERTMALVMGQGQKNPVYGFDALERMGQGWKAFVNQVGKLPEGAFRLLAEDNNTAKLEDLVKKTELPREALRDFSVSNSDLFNRKRDSIRGKTWTELSDADKAFVLEVAVSQENEAIRSGTDRELTKLMAEKAGKNIDARNTDEVYSEDKDVSRNAINRVLDGGDFEKYREVRNNYDTWQGYQDWTEEGEKGLAKSASWSGGEQVAGNIAGVIGRYLWEDAILRGATGGISPRSLLNPRLARGVQAAGAASRGLSMNRISDVIAGSAETGTGILGKLAARGIAPTSRFGKAVLDTSVRLIGTIPEDFLQDAVDNVVTYNAEANKELGPEQIPQNLVSDLVVMSIFNAARAGYSAVKKARLAKQLAQQADLASVVNIEGVSADVDDIARSIKKGGDINVTDESVSVLDESGSEKVLRNISPEQGRIIQRSLSDSAGEASSSTPRAVTETGVEPTVRVEIDTPNGRRVVEAVDYRIQNINDGLDTKITPTPANVKSWHMQTLDRAMTDFAQTHLPDFQSRYPDVRVSDFDWVFYNSRNGRTPEQIIGTIDPTTNREVTKEMIDAMQWFSDQPFMKDLRMASRNALGLDGDFNILGYLPHTTYDPSNLSFDEALTGRLWETYTGASMIDDDNLYKGFGGDFDSRYRTFASNMLWDAKTKDVAAAKLIEEASMDGKTITPEQAMKATEGQQDISRKVSDAGSTKELEQALISDEDADKIDFDKIDENTKKQAENSGLGKAIHDNYAEVYFGANSATVAKQSGAARQAFDTLGNTMRNTQIIDSRGRRMSWYDWGGADYVYARQNANAVVDQYMREGGDFRDMLIDFIKGHSHRSDEYAEAVADRWLKRLGDVPGELTKGKAIDSLTNAMKWEAMNRMRKFFVMAKYDEFNPATRKTIDRFLFSHMQMDAVKNNQKIISKLGKALDVLTGLRYRALFYGNLKNALLQTSELNRLFTTFKWGDVGRMAKRMATDETFRARVDDYVRAVAPETRSMRAEMYNDYSNVADSIDTNNNGTKVTDKIKEKIESVDNIALAPIENAEAFKNRMMVAALVQEADSLGLSGDEALRHIRNRFERVALAMNELGRIGLASNPMARTMLFLQNFQIRELGMHIYNLNDAILKGTTVPKKVYNAVAYLSKVLGTKLATVLVLSRFGYSANQILGIDPFGLLDNYTGLDEEDMEWQDYLMKSPIFAGGMTSLISDMYFMARRAYEESNPKTISEEAEENLTGESSWGIQPSFDQLMGLGQAFLPGNVFLNRIGQMTEMMDTGWATSASGNKMYTAPSDPLNIALGYIFGRSATANAQQYNQTYGDNLLQTLGRFNPFRQYGEFDPIDTKNYSDWFKGDGNDLQQFNKGLRYFRNERDRIIDEYENAIQRGYSDDEDAEAKNNMNQKLNQLYEQLDRFVDAYENKNGTINSAMVKQIVNVLNTGRKVLGDTSAQAEQRSMDEYNKALERYSGLGLSPVGTYTGPTTAAPEREVKYQGSPQYRAAVSGRYTVYSEAVAVLKEADKVLQDMRKELRQAISDAYDKKDYNTLNSIQTRYLRAFDKVVAPIIATYGNGILNSTDVTNQLKNMLSTGTTSRSGDLVPSSQYRRDKYGRYRSMPYETVNIKKWAQQRYSSNIFKNPTVRSYSVPSDDISAIQFLISRGDTDRARARALQLKVRVDNQKRAISQTDYNWLLNFLNNGGQQ